MAIKPVTWILFVVLLGGALSGCLDTGGDPGDTGDGAGPDETEQEDPDSMDDDPPRADGNETPDPDDPGDDDPPDNGDGNGDDNKTEEDDPDNETVDYDPGWPDLDDAAIRPGVSIAGGCTANFIFSSMDNRTLYIGTASHCVGGQDPNSTVSIEGGRSGTLVYCSWMFTEGEDHCPESENNLILNENDFALVRIDEGDREGVHPAMLHWGGPTGLGSPPSMGTKTLSYGNSKPGNLRPIEGYVLQSNPVSTTMYAVAPGIPGDSGSPVIRADGNTVGVLYGLGLAPFPASNSVANLDNSLEYMTEKTGLEVELKTWELLEPPLLP